MTPASVLALVVVLNGARATTQETVAVLPAADCLATMRALWALPADQAAGAPTLDAYCQAPGDAPLIGNQLVLSAAPMLALAAPPG